MAAVVAELGRRAVRAGWKWTAGWLVGPDDLAARWHRDAHWGRDAGAPSVGAVI